MQDQRAQSHVQAVVSVVVIGMVALIGLAIVAAMFSASSGLGLGSVDAMVEFPTTGEANEISSSMPNDPLISATTGIGIALDGDSNADSFADIPADDGWREDDWTLMIVAEPGDLQDGATHTLFAFDNDSIALEWHDGEYRAYVDDPFNNAIVSVDAPAGQTPIALTYDSSVDEITLYTPEQSDTSDFNTYTIDRQISQSWEGSLDEARVLNESIDQQSYDVFADDPIDPLADKEHAARLMFDEGDGTTTKAYYTGSQATLNGASWVPGIEGPELVEGTDYEISDNPFSVTVLSGGYLDGAPVFYVLSTSSIAASLAVVGGGFGSAMSLIPIILLTMMAGIVIAVTGRMRQ